MSAADTILHALRTAGPCTARDLAGELHRPAEWIRARLRELEAIGAVRRDLDDHGSYIRQAVRR